jgi:hypothetical protein
VFAPLKSQFMLSSPATSTFAQAILHLPTSSDGAPMHSPGMGAGPRTESAGGGRRGWLRDWEVHNPDRPSPCSAKAIYRLADSEFMRHNVCALGIHNLMFQSLTWPSSRLVRLHILQRARLYRVCRSSYFRHFLLRLLKFARLVI